MDLIDRIIQLNNGFPDPLSAYPKHILFYIVPPSIPTISTPIVDEDAALYVHVPFCSRKCSFCFIDITESPTPIDLDLYVETLITEILMSQTLAEKRTIRSIYIGGGTPTILSGEQLSRIIDALHSVFVIAIDAIWEIDATAVTLTASKLESLSSLGIGHLNIGIQSIEKSVLKNIAREWQTDTNLEKVGKLTQEY